MIIAVDFDGTIVTADYPRIGRDVGAIPWLLAFQRNGAKLILHTMRSGAELQAAVDYLSGHGVKLWGVNRNPDQHTWSDSPKIYANLYIDDAAFGCPTLLNKSISPSPFVVWEEVGPAVLHLIRSGEGEKIAAIVKE